MRTFPGVSVLQTARVFKRRVIENGRVYILNASIHGRLASCFVNHRTQEAEVAEIVPEVVAAARSIAGAWVFRTHHRLMRDSAIAAPLH